MNKLISIFLVIFLSTKVSAQEISNNAKPDSARSLITACGKIRDIFVPEQLNSFFNNPTKKFIDVDSAKNSNEFLSCWRYITGVIDTIITLRDKGLIPSKNVLSYDEVTKKFNEKPDSSICFIKPRFNLRVNVFLLFDILSNQYEKIPEEDRDTPGSAVLMISDALTNTFPCLPK